jgi:Leucine-rich repeat (LRR) protein
MVMVWIEKCPVRTVPPPSPKLESLNLRCTLVEALPDLAKNPNLSSIHITDAPLTQLPNDLGELQLLEEVHVSKCPNLTELPDSICRLAKLKTLEVYDTGLAAVPDRIGDLTALRRLVLGSDGSNRLTAVPDSLCDIEKLHLLWLANNQLESLPARIGALKSLQYLSVNHNNLTSLPDSVFELHPFTLEDQFRFNDNPIPAELVENYKARIKEICRADRAARKAARLAAEKAAQS